MKDWLHDQSALILQSCKRKICMLSLLKVTETKSSEVPKILNPNKKKSPITQR